MTASSWPEAMSTMPVTCALQKKQWLSFCTCRRMQRRHDRCPHGTNVADVGAAQQIGQRSSSSFPALLAWSRQPTNDGEAHRRQRRSAIARPHPSCQPGFPHTVSTAMACWSSCVRMIVRRSSRMTATRIDDKNPSVRPNERAVKRHRPTNDDQRPSVPAERASPGGARTLIKVELAG